ncbi:hypothetical protein [Plantactinospora endophytica]|uniref:Lipoprotein n=1 Tax=Plantactinospora endophytica TaxID=673535 RepID=A0ABQ4E1K3_9ACTN|nr:hypothetical protein [Plantactinospora endophytica]GIG88545.1 hypothetical protein Pen02_34810 [Plantactinospora endophytica]
MLRRHVVAVGLLAGLVTGCTESPYPLPDRDTAAVRDEEKRLAALLPDTLLGASGTCRVRLLGSAGSSSFAWAICETAPTADGPAQGVSVPVRVDEDQVTEPADGAGYAASVRRMFPRRLAETVLQDPGRLHP